MKQERRLAIPPEVITQALAGEAEAWGEIYSTLRPFILGLCVGTYELSPEDSNDISQNIFLQMVRSLDRIENLGAWICGAVRRQVGGLKGGRGPRLRVQYETSSRLEDALGFWYAYSCLSQMCRRLFHHMIFEGLSHREAARQIGIPPGSIHHLKNRCQENFILIFKRRDA